MAGSLVAYTCFSSAFLFVLSALWALAYEWEYSASFAPEPWAGFADCTSRSGDERISVFEMANNYSHPCVYLADISDEKRLCCNPNAIAAELSWHGRQGGWRVYIRDMLRAFAYVMALPSVASLTEHYGQTKTDLHLVASTGLATGLTVCIIKTTEVLAMSHWISRHNTDEFDRRLLQMLWTNKSMVDTNFWGSVNTSGFCLGCGFLCHSINIKHARSQSSISRHFVRTPLLQGLGYITGALLLSCALLFNMFHGPVMYLGAVLHVVLLPAWLTTLGVGIYKAEQDAPDDTARLSDSQCEISDLGPSASATQRSQVNAP